MRILGILASFLVSSSRPRGVRSDINPLVTRGGAAVSMSSDPPKSSLPEECVWDYPRPAVCEPFKGTLSIEMMNGKALVARSTSAWRTLETSHPPTYYIPVEDIDMKYLIERPERSTMCEWKGKASYYDLVDESGKVIAGNVAWTYSDPTPTFTALKHHLSFYAQHFQSCMVNEEKVVPQDGDFYGGWITRNLKGPFKGGAGTWGW